MQNRSHAETVLEHPIQAGESLPVEANVQALEGGGWTIRVPVRVEHVTVSKQTVVVEELWVRRKREEDVAHVQDTVRREKLRLETEGEVDVLRPSAPVIPPSEAMRKHA